METLLKQSHEIDSESWNELINNSKQGSIYSLYEYVNTLTSREWCAVLCYEKSALIGCFPLIVRSKYGINYFLHPPFCQYWGVILRDKEFASEYKKYEYLKKLITSILAEVPKDIKIIKTYLAPTFEYLLPFIWDGWKLSPHLTYQINLDRSLEDIHSAFASHARREIKKATESGITIKKNADAEQTINLFRDEKPHLVHKKNNQYLNNLETIVRTLPDSKAFSLVAELNGEVISGIIYFIHDNQLTYFFGTVQSAHKNSGAMSLIIWESICLYHNQCKILDFEGSMIKNIERFFRGFDAKPVTYFKASRNNIPLLNKFNV